MKENVGASIVRIITESLYDKPIVVFREYVQNSVDSFLGIVESEQSHLSSCIWREGDSLFFLDNGNGIPNLGFEEKMRSIARSNKSKVLNIGYKGIGRLSGLAYCRNLKFFNIVDYVNHKFQAFYINGDVYRAMQKEPDFNQKSFDDLMNKIGTIDEQCTSQVEKILDKQKELFEHRNTGFLVVLEGISNVLSNVIDSDDFIKELSWLLPVTFNEKIMEDELFAEISSECVSDSNNAIPARAYPIFFEGKALVRPLAKEDLRTNICRCNIGEYAVCVHTFSGKKIEIDKRNSFSGIRIYIDNMLLCDENELMSALQQYGMLSHGLYEMIQSVRGIGALIYIVDKVSISANARRTFIDVTDHDALSFLSLVSDFVENIYRARYALSDYHSAKRKNASQSAVAEEKINELRIKAQTALEDLAKDEIIFEEMDVEQPKFEQLSNTEKKRIVKTKINKELTALVSKYLSQASEFNPDTCFDDFKTWFRVNS